MKLIFLLSLFPLSVLIAQPKVSLEEISNYMNQNVTVCGKIYGSYITKVDSPITLLNVGDKYPNHLLTIAIFGQDVKKFDYVPADYLVEKTICVSGKLIDYKGKPEIIVRKQKEIEIMTD